jgi:hypothetical protein
MKLHGPPTKADDSLPDRNPSRGDQMAPVIKAFQSTAWARCRVLFTAQHRHLVGPS